MKRSLLIAALVLAFPIGLVSCGLFNSIPQAHAPCVSGFRNDTNHVLSDVELEAAWERAQHMIANGQWVENALTCQHIGGCITHPPDARALNERPKCNGVRGAYGTVYQGADGVTDGENIAIRLDEGHTRAYNLASYEFENVIGCTRLGYDCGNR